METFKNKVKHLTELIWRGTICFASPFTMNVTCLFHFIHRSFLLQNYACNTCICNNVWISFCYRFECKIFASFNFSVFFIAELCMQYLQQELRQSSDMSGSPDRISHSRDLWNMRKGSVSWKFEETSGSSYTGLYTLIKRQYFTYFCCLKYY